MSEIFRYITPITYGLIVSIWLYILIFYIKKIRYNHNQDKLLNLLLFILLIDALRTIFEGVFFGLRHASQAGFLSEHIYLLLQQPQYVFLPKFVTLITGVLVLIIVIYRWLPAEYKQKLAVKELINKKNSELLAKNKELTIAKEKAEASDRLKTEFLNNISHEIRTPMNGIIGFAGMLDDPGVSSESRAQYSKIVQNSGEQLLRVIDDILEISNLETKQETLHNSTFNLNEFVMELFSIFELKAKETDIAFNVNKALSDNKSFITSDKTKLGKILGNLLENAFRYTTEGAIEFGYSIIGNNLELYVKDSGIGIAPENHDMVFDRFSQEEKELSRKNGGLGLGLAISKENALLLGGDITLESEKGKGATFYVTIPYLPAHNEKEKSSKISLDADSVTASGVVTVLVAEDEDINYLFLKTVLKKSQQNKYKIMRALNGKEALEISTERNDIDIVFMDIKMPIMDGLEATEKIKLIKPNLPIIVQTAYTGENDKKLALESGCDDFVSKPIGKEQLFALIEKHTNK